MHNKLQYGMVGGGAGAFIGEVHRIGAVFDDLSVLTAGCFSRDFDNTKETAVQLGVDAERAYKDYREMAEKESIREDGIDFVVIVTPNNSHYHIAKAFLESGIAVVCDKPLTITVEEAVELERITKERDLLFCVTYANQGYSMVKQARQMIKDGVLGDLRMVMGEYPQEWLATPVEKDGLKVAWRVDPKFTGISSSVADIGSHLENIISYVTGMEIARLCAKLDVIGEGRSLDTNGSIIVEYDNGVSGMYWCSQIAIGSENALKFRIIGSKGTIEWAQEKPDHLIYTPLGEARRTLSKGNGYLNESGLAYNRIPPGHPTGTFEAFANIYKSFCTALIKKKSGEPLTSETIDYPDISEGVRGMKFIYSCVGSSKDDSAWKSLDK